MHGEAGATFSEYGNDELMIAVLAYYRARSKTSVLASVSIM
jgi:hypothetical protein